MQQCLHDKQGVEARADIVDHYARTFWQPLQLPYWRRLPDIEASKKHKTRQQAFPRNRGGNQRNQLPCNFINDDELGIF